MVKKKDDILLIDEQNLTDATLLEEAPTDSPGSTDPALLSENDELSNDALMPLPDAEMGNIIPPFPETVASIVSFDDDARPSERPVTRDELLTSSVTFAQSPQMVEDDRSTDRQTELTDTTTVSPKQTNDRRQSGQILAIDEEARVHRAEDSENQLWMMLRNARRSHRILSSTLSGIERLENGLPLAIVYYQGMRIAIPATEMALPVRPQDFANDAELYNRYAQLLSRMLASEIDFTIAGLDRRDGVVLGSRSQAMQRKQQRYYHTLDAQGKALISEGQVVEARVISVSEKLLRVEVFGVETNVTAREIAWEWVDDAHEFYQVGDRVLVKVQTIRQDDEGGLTLSVSIREATNDPTAENLQKCSMGGKYIGTVTGIENVIYVRLNIGVNAIATTVRDPRTVCRKDEVSFVVTRIDHEAGLAVGIITRIIKQAN